MLCRLALIGVLALAAAALVAEISSAEPMTAGSQLGASPAPASIPPPPQSAGSEKPQPISAHVCSFFYPPGPFLNGIQGTTLMTFTVNPDGHVANPVVKTSSGNADLDDAASRCVLHWAYRPAMKDGVAVAAPWTADVVWRLSSTLKLLSSSPCNLPPQAHTQPPGTYSMFTYRVTAKGDTSYLELRLSNANNDLDKAAKDCVASWRFEPRKDSDGEPIDTYLKTTVFWTPPDIGALPASKPIDLPALAPLPADFVPPKAGTSKACGHGVNTTVPDLPGYTKVRFTIDKDGSVKNPIISVTSGSDEWDKAASDCVAGWSYTPAMHNGTPVPIAWEAVVYWINH